LSSRRQKKDRSRSGSPELTAEQIAVLEQRKREEEAEEGRRQAEEDRRRRSRERELEEMKRRNERRAGEKSGPVYKGRGAMKAPGEGLRGW
jgi:hypothetical protein